MTITAILQDRNARTANSFHQDGCYMGCYDLANNFGATGASIAATRGRYAWIVSADHPAEARGTPQTGGWYDGQHILVGFTTDPGTLPTSLQVIWRASTLFDDPRGPPGNKMVVYHFNDLVYNPDDATYPFYLYVEGYTAQGPRTTGDHEGCLIRSSDLFTWTGYGATHPSSGFTSFQRVVRNGAGDWFSLGPAQEGYPGEGPFGINIWTSTDALHWTCNGTGNVPKTMLNRAIGDSTFGEAFGKPLTFMIGSDTYMTMREDARNADGGMYVTAVPVDTGYNIIATGTPPAIRLTPKYDGTFPSLGYLQGHWTYIEDGIMHMFVSHGYYADASNPGQGMHEAGFDYYTIILDATAAANAAPAAVRAECRYGAVILTWRDALPNKTYRVYRSTTGIGGTYTSLGDVTGLNFVDAVGNVGVLYYYKVVTRHSGADQGSRIVGVYVSSGRHLTNEHIKRVTLASGTDINAGWLDTVTGWLRDNCLTNRLMFWADPSFGVIKDGSNHLSKVFCLGSTLHTYGGDYTPAGALPSTAVTYNATGLASTIPAFVNSSATAHGFFGGERLNNIRRKAEITMAAVYSRPSGSSDATFFGTSEFGGIWFTHASGTPGDLEFHFRDTGYNVFASKTASSATTAQFSAGTFDGTDIVAYSNGVAGAPAQGVLDNFLLDGQRGADHNIDGGLQEDFLGVGSQDVKYAGGTRIYGDNQADFTCAALIIFDVALSAAQMTSLNTLLAARIGGATYSLPSYDTPFVKNIVTDYSAVGDGSTDVASAFASFATAVATWQATHTGLVVLQVPAGTYRFTGSSGKFFTQGIPMFLLQGESRETTKFYATPPDNGWFFGNVSGTYFDNTHSARINTVAAGAATVTCVTSGDTGIFSTGQWVVVANGDVQAGGGGDPINPMIFEFKKIASIGSGTLTFTEPLVNPYYSTWPLYSAGDALHSDTGGPGTVYALHPGFDCEHEYRELNIDQDQTKSAGRFITYTRSKATGAGWIFPTENYHWTANDFEQTAISMEIDKVIETATVNGGVYSLIQFQSPSPNRFELLGCAVLQNLSSTPKVSYLDGFYVADTLKFGPWVSGAATKVVALNGCFGTYAQGGVAETGLVAAGYTMSGGIISVSDSHKAVVWATPGATVLWSAGSVGAANSFKVTDISQSGGSTHITTDQSGGFPSLGGTLGVRTHPAPKLLMRGVQQVYGGSAAVPISPISFSFNNTGVDISHAPPFAPGFSYIKRNYRMENLNVAPAFQLYGKLVSVTATVATAAYSGTHNPLLMSLFGQFGGVVIEPDGTQTKWNPQIDLRTLGTRVITPTGVTGTVGADANLTAPTNPIWLDDTFQPYLAFDISSEFAGPGTVGTPENAVAVTIVLDQSTMGLTSATLRTFACHFV